MRRPETPNDTTPDRRRSLPCPGCGEPGQAASKAPTVRRLGQRWHRACWDARPTHGGRRPGAGRPPGSRTAEPTRVLSVRVPAALLDRVQAAHPQAFLRGYLLAALQRLG